MSKLQILLLFLFLVWSENLAAEEWNSENWDGFAALRLGIPYFSGLEINDSGETIHHLAALQLGVYLDSHWSGELEYEMAHHHVTVGAIAARVGYTFQLHGLEPWQSEPKGYLIPLIGYQYSGKALSVPTVEDELLYNAHAIEVALAYDLIWGVTGGFTLRAFVATDIILGTEKRSENSWEPNDKTMQWGARAGVRIGYNFSF